MKLYAKKCKNPKCEKIFQGTQTQQYCCPECRSSASNQKQAPKQVNKCTINEVAKIAKEKGISYGKYVAMQYQKERKRK